jgi:hypothetical protein
VPPKASKGNINKNYKRTKQRKVKNRLKIKSGKIKKWKNEVEIFTLTTRLILVVLVCYAPRIRQQTV